MQIVPDEKTRTWLQGDMHAENIGSFENGIGELVYDLNDFDDAVIADYQFDVWRMAVSLQLVARRNGIAGDTAVGAFAKSYLEVMLSYEGKHTAIETYFTQGNVKCKTPQKFLEKVKEKKTRKKMLKKWTRDESFDLVAALDTPATFSRAYLFEAMGTVEQELPKPVGASAASCSWSVVHRTVPPRRRLTGPDWTESPLRVGLYALLSILSSTGFPGTDGGICPS